MIKFGTSQSVTRKEDLRLLTGQGKYCDDTAAEGALHAMFLRSPVAHATFEQPDLEEARAVAGVHAIYTAADLEGELKNQVAFHTVKNRDGSNGAAPVRPVLADGTVRYVGEAVALVVAETKEAALDAMDLIMVDYHDLPVHVATAVGGPTIHKEAPDNLAYDWSYGDAEATDRAFATAAHTTSLDLIDNRIHNSAMEGRGCHAVWDGSRLHMEFTGQGVWNLKNELAENLGLEPEAVQVTTGDVGGGFGTKGFNYPEYFAVAFAARKLNTPVRWMSGRGEAMLTDVGGRDHVTTAEAAFDADFRLKAVRINCISNLGAYNSFFAQYIASELALKVLPGVYDFQTALFNVKGVFTNTTPVDAYRGAGRPEAIYVIERLMDVSARELGKDPIEFRRKNFIPKEKFPYRTVSGELYDVGDFNMVLDRALKEANVAGFKTRKAKSAAAGKLRGLGLCYYIESILGDPVEHTQIDFAEDGFVDLYVGTQSNGQGHETVFAQFLTERAGIPFDKIRFIQGDSDRIAMGGGTGGSRSVTLQGNSINKTADEAIRKFRELAAEELEIADADLVWEDGSFSVAGTDRSVDLMHLAGVARERGLTDLLSTRVKYDLPARSYPNGAHFAEVEVDPDTGQVSVQKYTVVDDFGYLVNPMLAEGQVHGGVVQGVGQAVTEEVVYSEDGQLLSGSFMDYAMPRAADMPMINFFTQPVLSTANEIGMKGCGEAGTVGSLASVTNAVLDALWDSGVRHVDMPLTPSRVWNILNSADATLKKSA
ncbi:xanthine dehydrogenase family protein molybdopterin-binding subunit [Amaricoccus tamworthensis]|uniref:xanthine dehydrogenase family protein molybdopterin-binding subunit n=1 Tax=Amaricoccus tamworthensis TaxID=57002 RepID=UPI003C7C3183